MSSEHFSLLSVRSGDRLEFTGPLARVLAPRLRDNKIVKAVVALAGLKRGSEVELVGMDTQVSEDGVFSASPTGPMA